MPGDLHTHTTFSDGSTPAQRLPFLAHCAGLTALAISDHDSIRSVRFAKENPYCEGVALLPAVELSAWDDKYGHRVHLLCYCPDDGEALQSFTSLMAQRRLNAALESCKQLEQLYPQFTTQEALELAKPSGTMFKSHMMRVLWQYGLADGLYGDVYHRLFAKGPQNGGVLRLTRYESVKTVLNVIHESRGVAVLAHPSVYQSMPLARELIEAGLLDGVEIDHPRNTPEDRDALCMLAEKYHLIATGGSDYHGMNTKIPRPVGAGVTDDASIDRILTLARARKAKSISLYAPGHKDASAAPQGEERQPSL